MDIRNANKADSRAIAELALMAGEGIPGYFWAEAAGPGEDILDVGARNASSDTENFSWRNTRIATIDERVAGMVLAYRLPDAEHADDVDDYPEFLRPLIELEHLVPESFYVNMLAAYPEYRGQGVGSALMCMVDGWAREAGCDLASIQVFEENTGALRLYQRLGYGEIARRAAVPHASHPYTGDVVLLTKRLTGNAHPTVA